MSSKEKILLIFFAMSGWAFCGTVMGLGMKFFSMQTALILHLILGPAGFGVLSFLYNRRGPQIRPLTTASIWTFTVILMDAALIAPFIEKSYAMFQSMMGTWLPFTFIFIITYLVGQQQYKNQQAS